MGIGLNAQQIKLVIDALRKGKPMTFSELRKLHLPGQKGRIPRTIPTQSLTRYLHYLKFWGLCEQDESTKRWVWKQHIKRYTTETEYTQHLEHSNKLSTWFRVVLDEIMNPAKTDLNSAKTDKYKQFCEEHLETGYPDVYNKLVELRKLQSKLEQLELQIGGQQWRSEKEVGAVRVFPFPDKDRAARATREEYEACDKTHQQILEVCKELLGEIELIKMKIEMGTPLEGICQTCPNFTITKNE